jgi:hypothetical protein
MTRNKITYRKRSGAPMFEIGFEWWRGFAQVAVYSGVIVAILWILSKIELPDRGESPIGEEKGKG